MITARSVSVSSISCMNSSMERASAEGTRSLPIRKIDCLVGSGDGAGLL